MKKKYEAVIFSTGFLIGSISAITLSVYRIKNILNKNDLTFNQAVTGMYLFADVMTVLEEDHEEVLLQIISDPRVEKHATEFQFQGITKNL